MPATIARAAQEFDALVSRAARRGVLEVDDLIDAYTALAPAAHPLLAEPRQLDLQALVNALAALPAEFITAPRVCVVPRLERFAGTPVAASSARAAKLDDGTLLIEGRLGHLSLLALAGPLCVLRHETAKAHALMDDLVATQQERLAQQSTTRNDNDRASGPGEQTAVLELSLAQVAFALGVDELSWLAAETATNGALSTALAPDWRLPEIALHADFGATARRREAHTAYERVFLLLAEMGLVGRPLHLWIGPGAITDCVSPYTRELREVITTWARQHPEALGDDLVLGDDAPGEDTVYALAQELLAAEPRLDDERRAAERTVGILREGVDGFDFDIIDLGRLDAGLCDARLPRWQVQEPAPVLIRIAASLDDASDGGLAALLAPIAARLRSITLALDGSARGAPDGALFLPDVLVRWAGEHLLAVPAANRVQPGDFAGLTSAVSVGGGALCVPHASLLSAGHMGELGRELKANVVTLGGDALLDALARAVWAGVLAPEVEIVWAVVSGRTVASGRPSLATQGGHSALALWRLRGILPKLEPAVTTGRRRPGGGSGGSSGAGAASSGRQIRIKA